MLPHPLSRSLLVVAASLVGVPPCVADSPVIFNRDVRPILSEHCFECHGPDAATREADLRLDVSESARRVLMGDDGSPAELLRRISTDDADEIMPPADRSKPLSTEQKKILSAWISSGARYQEHWAFIPPKRPRLPENPEAGWASTAVDHFVWAKLRENDLEPSPPAALTTLARRVSFDLTGLPPSGEALRNFLDEVSGLGSERAYQRWISRLMQSPRCGEHMALPWLEAARYADTDGYQNDRYRYQHVWRDWVIRAYSDNMPYDRFVIEQLAGDLLPGATLWQQVATGFGRNHRINSEDGSIDEEWRTENVVDRVDTFGTVFLGLTIGCARCHDHKYDPISQKEYYRLFAYFNNVAEIGIGPNNGNSPPFVEVPASWPMVAPDEDCLIQPEPVKLRRAREDKGNGLRRPQAGSPQTVMVMHELEQPRETFLLVRGQYNMPDKSERLWPGVPGALSFDPSDSVPQDRLALARWLVDPRNPLVARVAVNRIWQQIFGVGLVKSSENFGSQGSQPSHPDLLDWLATELVHSGWDVRHIQRIILLSSTYRQSSVATEELLRRDPKNRLLARGPRLRLNAFALRDQALASSGLLVERIGGPSAKPYMPPKIWSSISNNKYEQDVGSNLYRRSLYTYWRRTIPPPTMMNFNAAAREVCSVRTESTNTPLQALTLMNNDTFVEATRFLAQRMMQRGAADIDLQIETGFQLATSRRPNQRELRVLRRAYDTFAQQYASDTQAAEQLLSAGEAPRDGSLDVVRHAALTMTASLIMNLDETISKE